MDFCVILTVVVSSSSGPGRLVLIQEIAGSTPAGTTNRISLVLCQRFFVGVWFESAEGITAPAIATV